MSLKQCALAISLLCASGLSQATTITFGSNSTAGITGYDRLNNTITISSNGSAWTPPASLGYWAVVYAFTLPVGYSNPVLTLTNVAADDRVMVTLNGNVLGGTGIFGPNVGPHDMPPLSFSSFSYGANGSSISTSSPGLFMTGANYLTFSVNDTFNGVFGSTVSDGQGGPTSLGVTGQIDFRNGGSVPEPGSLMIAALGLLTLGAVRRQRR